MRVNYRTASALKSGGVVLLSHAHPEVEGAEFVVFTDPSRKYVDCTDGVCRLLGYSREELLTKTIDDIAAPELRPQVSETFREYVSQGELEGNYSLVAKDGSRIPIRYQAKVYPDGCYVARWKPLDQETRSQLRKDQTS